mmetsp:Transcript_33313/g.43945  ORF Transcript_33313/g.43945 Transcript_33313/m.43945 type:complete len:619 (-) Transcript_33313:401-2257(-)|eukprot:CAMPEP_0117753714 /NCGR_PEP_ID=MMETSP0947-20121206/12397_1 /TAXON_ID=44440 /ORGANISM="Chattonella subsalsa, Strain CCMP2191" /LENGTH=618 /DNA_ID=CAMNT_0005572663 /DNA_START=202 /DNA_END=2058 /DNA_ORIENTATION=-
MALTFGTFCISGNFSVPQREIEQTILQHGGKVVKSVTKSVQYLISSEGCLDSIKVHAAFEKDIPIVTEGFISACIKSGGVLRRTAKQTAPFLLNHKVDIKQKKQKQLSDNNNEKDNETKLVSTALQGGVFVLNGRLTNSMGPIQSVIIQNGGKTMDSVTKSVTHIVSSENNLSSSKVQAAIKKNIPVVKENFIDACIQNGGLLDVTNEANSKFCIAVKATKTEGLKDVFKHAVFTISGNYSTLKEKLSLDITQRGGKLQNSFTDKTTHVICGDGLLTSKVNDAKQSRIPVVSESYIQACIEQGELIDMRMPQNFQYLFIPKMKSHENPPKIRRKKAKKDKTKVFLGCEFVISGIFQIGQWKMKETLMECGGKISDTITNTVTHVIFDEENISSKVTEAFERGIPIVKEAFIQKSLDNGEAYDLSLEHNSRRFLVDVGSFNTNDRRPVLHNTTNSFTPKLEYSKELERKNVFLGCEFIIAGQFEKYQWFLEQTIMECGGKIFGTVTNNVTHAIFGGENMPTKILEAFEKGIPVVNEAFIQKSIDNGDALDLNLKENSKFLVDMSSFLPNDQRNLASGSGFAVLKRSNKQHTTKETEGPTCKKLKAGKAEQMEDNFSGPH